MQHPRLPPSHLATGSRSAHGLQEEEAGKGKVICGWLAGAAAVWLGGGGGWGSASHLNAASEKAGKTGRREETLPLGLGLKLRWRRSGGGGGGEERVSSVVRAGWKRVKKSERLTVFGGRGIELRLHGFLGRRGAPSPPGYLLAPFLAWRRRLHCGVVRWSFAAETRLAG